MTNKAMIQAGSLVISTLAIAMIILFFYVSLSKLGVHSTAEIKFQREALQQTAQALSLFQQTFDDKPITELLIQQNTATFSEMIKEIYGMNPKCRLIVDGKKLDVGCREIDSPPHRLKLEVPYSDQSIHTIILEVVK